MKREPPARVFIYKLRNPKAKMEIPFILQIGKRPERPQIERAQSLHPSLRPRVEKSRGLEAQSLPLHPPERCRPQARRMEGARPSGGV